MLPRAAAVAVLAGFVSGCDGSGTSTPASPSPAPAQQQPALQTIAELTGSGVDTGAIAVGQSVTVTGGSFNNVRFRFVVPSGFESAVGTLFLLDREYLGTTTALNAATAGVLASTSRIESGEWLFEPTARIAGGTKYWFVTTSAMRVYTTPDGARDFYAGGDVYTGNDVLPFRQFVPSPGARIDALFQLRGIPSS